MKYKLTIDPILNKTKFILDTEKQCFIPIDEANTDYQEYLKWVAEGNTPEPADEVTE